MRIKRLSTVFLVSVLLILQCSAMALARSSDYLDAYGVYLTPVSGGKIVFTADVNALRAMTKVGVTILYIYESKNGLEFLFKKCYRYEDYPIMMGAGYYHYEDIITYEGTPGYKYYAIAYCYAGDSTGYDEKTSTSAMKTAFR